MGELGIQDRPWSVSHAFFANLGGLVIDIGAPGQEEVVAGAGRESDRILEKRAESQPHSFSCSVLNS